MAAQTLTDAVFLSASVPDPRRDPRYYGTADFAAIREAVVALATVVLPNGALVFGGHPAISPLVLLVAKQFQAAGRVRIYQSEFFRGHIPQDSMAFPSMVWTPIVNNDKDRSLEAMRNTMVGNEPLRAGVFMGGMEGVQAEYDLFRARHPQLPAYAVASTGAAARMAFDADPGQPSDAAVRHALETDLVYDALFRGLPGVA